MTCGFGDPIAAVQECPTAVARCSWSEATHVDASDVRRHVSPSVVGAGAKLGVGWWHDGASPAPPQDEHSWQTAATRATARAICVDRHAATVYGEGKEQMQS